MARTETSRQSNRRLNNIRPRAERPSREALAFCPTCGHLEEAAALAVGYCFGCRRAANVAKRAATTA